MDINLLYRKWVYQESFIERVKLSQFVSIRAQAEKRLDDILKTIEKHPLRLSRKEELEEKASIAKELLEAAGSRGGVCYSCKHYNYRDDTPNLDEIACSQISPPLRYADDLLAFCTHFEEGDEIIKSAAKITNSVNETTVQSLKNVLKSYSAELGKLSEAPRRF